MDCENSLCIYCWENRCILSKISVDGTGLCSQCIYPDFPPKTLEQAKQELLKKLSWGK